MVTADSYGMLHMDECYKHSLADNNVDGKI